VNGELTGAILAGGQSRRMGRPKEGVVLWDGRPMIEHVVASVQAVCGRVVIVGACRGWTPAPDVIHLDDCYTGAGPLGGIATLLASGLDQGYLVVACDQPLVPPRAFRLLLGSHQPGIPCFLRASDGTAFDPFPGYFPATWLGPATAALRTRRHGVRDVIRQGRVDWVTLPAPWRRRMASLNSPLDLARVTRSSERCSSDDPRQNCRRRCHTSVRRFRRNTPPFAPQQT